MNTEQLEKQILEKRSFLCIGLDVDKDKIPPHLLDNEDPIFAFNKAIIDSTHHLAVAYKPNTAFYEAYGLEGWKSLQRTIDYLNETHPEIFTIADAKRGDIGNTSTRYARAFFTDLNFDSVTVAPYMGSDSVEPFLAFEDKFTILLALTSNKGGLDFQTTRDLDGEILYEKVLRKSLSWTNSDRLMYVVGATRPEFFAKIRSIVPDNFLLVPGIGAQGGDLHAVCEFGLNKSVGLLINSSRGIIYASKGKDFAEQAEAQAKVLQAQMEVILSSKGY